MFWVRFQRNRRVAARTRLEDTCRRVLERPNVKSKFRLHAQLHHAVRSGPSNIAEGFGKYGNKEFARYARIAKASEVEVLNHLLDLRDQRLISEDELMLAEHAAKKAIHAVVGLIRHLESTPDPPRSPKRDTPEP
jgi:four helix bundle protein